MMEPVNGNTVRGTHPASGGNVEGPNGGGLPVAKPRVSIDECSWYIGKISLDGRSPGSGKTSEAKKKILSEYDFSKSWVSGTPDRPALTVNFYISPNSLLKNEVFGEVKAEKDIIKGKDSRFFRDLLGNDGLTKPKEEAVEQIYKKVRKRGRPLAVGVFGRNSFMYTLYAERILQALGVPHKTSVYLDDFVPNIRVDIMPVLSMGSKSPLMKSPEVEGYYNSIARRILARIEKGGIGPDGLEEDQKEYLTEMASAAIRFLMYWPEPIYITKKGFGPYVFNEDRIRRMVSFGEVHIGSPEDYYAFMYFIYWLLGVPEFSVITPSKPRAARSLSSILEENSEHLLREALKIELLLMGIKGVPWALEAIEKVKEGKVHSISDIGVNALLINAMQLSGMDVHILNGTALTEGAGVVFHNKRAYLLTPSTDESGRFVSWHANEVISYNPEEDERDPDPSKGRSDVTITLDGITGFPTAEVGARRLIEETGIRLYSFRTNLDESTIRPLASIRSIIVPKPRGRITRLVENDLRRKLGGVEDADSFSWFTKRVRGAGSETLVKNLHIISRSMRFHADYEMITDALKLEDRLLFTTRGEGEGSYLGVYATIMLGELLNRYAKTPPETRVVLDPKLISLISKVPIRWAAKEIPELGEYYETVAQYMTSTIAQSNRGRSDRAVLDVERAQVIWLTAVDPLYERSERFRYWVGLSELTQTLGRFVWRGPGTAKEIDLVLLGSGPSGFTLRSIVSILDIINEVEDEEQMVPVIQTEGRRRVGKTIRLCGHTLRDLRLSEIERERRENLAKAPPEAVLTEQQWREVEEEMKKHDNALDSILAMLNKFAEFDSRVPLLSREWYEDPLFDYKTIPASDPRAIREMGEPRSPEDAAERMRKRKEQEQREREKYVRMVKRTLVEEYNLGTNIDSPETLKEVMRYLREHDRIPEKYRRSFWDVDGEPNPYLDDDVEGALY